MIFLLSALIALYIEKPSKTQHSLKNHQVGFSKKNLRFLTLLKLAGVTVKYRLARFCGAQCRVWNGECHSWRRQQGMRWFMTLWIVSICWATRLPSSLSPTARECRHIVMMAVTPFDPP